MKIAFLILFAGLLQAADRDAAVWVIRHGGRVTFEGNPRIIDALPDLPAADVRIVGVDLVGTDIAPTSLTELSGLARTARALVARPKLQSGRRQPPGCQR